MSHLKLELAQIVERRTLTALVQALVDSGGNTYSANAVFPCIGMTSLKGESLVFTESGAYAALPAMIQLLEDIADPHSPSART